MSNTIQFIWSWRRTLLHIPVGMYNMRMFATDKVAAVVFAIGFLLFYELVEDWRIKDHMYKDTQGYLFGFAIAFMIMHDIPWLINLFR